MYPSQANYCKHETNIRLSEILLNNNIYNNVCIGGIHSFPTRDMKLNSWIEFRDTVTKNVVVADVLNNLYVTRDVYNYLFEPEIESKVGCKELASSVNNSVLNSTEDKLAMFLLTHPENKLNTKVEGTDGESLTTSASLIKNNKSEGTD